MSRRSEEGKEGAAGLHCHERGMRVLGRFQMSRCHRCRIGTMSKVELAGRPEPGYESMEQFTVSVEHVAEMLRTIDFQPGEGARKGEAAGTGHQDPPGGGGLGHGAQPAGDSTSRGSSLGPGASGEEEDEDMAMDGEECNAGPEEERLDGPEGECIARAIAARLVLG